MDNINEDYALDKALKNTLNLLNTLNVDIISLGGDATYANYVLAAQINDTSYVGIRVYYNFGKKKVDRIIFENDVLREDTTWNNMSMFVRAFNQAAEQYINMAKAIAVTTQLFKQVASTDNPGETFAYIREKLQD